MNTTNFSRRKFIGVAAGAGGALALGDVASLFANPPLPSPAHSGISHIIVVMMENRSFDHFLGWLPRANGRQIGLTYYDSNGIAHPTYALATNTTTSNYQGCGLVDPDHSFEGGRVEYNNGACDGWRKQGANPSDVSLSAITRRARSISLAVPPSTGPSAATTSRASWPRPTRTVFICIPPLPTGSTTSTIRQIAEATRPHLRLFRQSGTGLPLLGAPVDISLWRHAFPRALGSQVLKY